VESGVCLVDHDLGAMNDGDVRSVTVSTGGAHAAYATSCGGTDGREQVLRLTTQTTVEITIGYAGQTGHHVIGVFRDTSGACDAQEVACFDTGGAAGGDLGPVTLAAGTYFLVVDASQAGDEGSVQITVTASAPAEPCLVQFGDDGVYRGCEIPHGYEDISATGTLVGSGDETEWTVSIGFAFDFYGTGYNQVTVGDNGALGFGGGTQHVSYYNGCLPDDLGDGQPGIAVFWDDLDCSTGGAQGVFSELRGTAPHRRFIVQWVTEHYLPSQTTGTASFQVVLYEDSGDVELRYLDTDFANASYDSGASATVGIEAGAQRPFVQYSCNQPDVASGSSLRFYRRCLGSAACQETDCTDGTDDDGDGLIDCQDGDCASAAGCPTTETHCADSADNDGDGALDCNDGDCFGDPACNPICQVGDCCYNDIVTMELPEVLDSLWLSTSDDIGGPRGAGHYFDDTYLYLLDSSCSVMASDDNGGAGTHSHIVATLPSTDVYVIVVTSATAGANGYYDLSLQ
jgi:hypothetical protein